MMEPSAERTDKAKYADWIAMFQRVLETSSAKSSACQSCDHQQLQLVFENVDRKSGIGQVAFWCNHCLTGIIFGRSNARSEYRISYRNEDPPPVCGTKLSVNSPAMIVEQGQSHGVTIPRIARCW